MLHEVLAVQRAAPGQRVEVGRTVLRRTVDTEVAVAEIVREDDDEIRLLRGEYGENGGKQECRELHRRYSIEPARIGRGFG